MRRSLLFLLLFAGLMLFFVDTGYGTRSAISQLYGLAHLVFFMFLALGLSRLPGVARCPFLSQFIVIMFVVLLVGAFIELIQPYFGRSARLRDLGNDAVGGLIGIVFLAPARHSLRQGVLVFGQLVAIVLTVAVSLGPVTTFWDMWQASRQFPILGDFEKRLETSRWSSGEIDKSLARHGKSSLRVFLGREKYSGTTLKRSFGDWRGYSIFAFSIYNPDPVPLPITVSIRDEEHFRRGGEYNDRFNRVFTMVQGWNDVSIPISDIENAPSGRKQELDHLSEVVIFTVDPPAPRVMYLDYVRLIR